jgi:peroxiredoxin family protein
METQTEGQVMTLTSDELERMVHERVDAYLKEKEAEKEQKIPKLAIIATKGTLDWAYPPLILATTAAALGWDVGIFFTFYGLNIIHKDKSKHLRVAPLGNPAMPMPVPNIVGVLPGMTAMGTTVMKRMFNGHHVASIDDLLEMAVESGVKMWPCGMTLEVFGYKQDDFIDGVQEVCGAAHFIGYAQDADVSLFI